MKKTFQDVLEDIQENLIGKELNSISGTAVSYRITCNNGNQRTLRNP